jgi:hypothetical protein
MTKPELDPEDRAWLEGLRKRTLATTDEDPHAPDERMAALADELVVEVLEPFRDLLPKDVYDELVATGFARALLDPTTAKLLEDLVPGATQISHDRVRKTAEPVRPADKKDEGTGGGT